MDPPVTTNTMHLVFVVCITHVNVYLPLWAAIITLGIDLVLKNCPCLVINGCVDKTLSEQFVSGSESIPH
jgi:hypothetical protein